ncbi:Exopolysaccharide synthesis, ExoD [Planctomycetes bacterium Pan216]|uniref:Exopolysaccharide synthesis, ExoD n=1 Tax=Kolteria novifilia TaxID=2527975 RepID=A0A518B5X7_9BACT|nr:Exopolysaccharide synthesis, ExoD [Planctomycetes bacterium Pan216]
MTSNAVAMNQQQSETVEPDATCEVDEPDATTNPHDPDNTDRDAEESSDQTDDQERSGSDEKPTTIKGVLDQLKQSAESSDDESIDAGDVRDAFGGRAHGPLLFIPALLALIPIIGGIPGASILTATLIICVAVQMFIGQQGIWLPKRVAEASISTEKLIKACDKSKRYLGWLDKLIHHRLGFLTKSPFSYVTPIICIALALTMFPLALVPAGVSAPAAAILLLSLGLVGEDGVMILLGWAGSIGCLWLAWAFFPF